MCWLICLHSSCSWSSYNYKQGTSKKFFRIFWLDFTSLWLFTDVIKDKVQCYWKDEHIGSRVVCILQWIEVIVNVNFSNGKYSGGLGHVVIATSGKRCIARFFPFWRHFLWCNSNYRCSKGYGECCPFCHFFQFKDGLRKLTVTGNRKPFEVGRDALSACHLLLPLIIINIAASWVSL